jgi:hypothetical protein
MSKSCAAASGLMAARTTQRTIAIQYRLKALRIAVGTDC